MNHFLQDYFKASYFQPDHLRAVSSTVEQEAPTGGRGGGSRKVWLFTLPSGKVASVTDPRLIRLLVEKDLAEEVLAGLADDIQSDAVAAAQRTFIEAVTVLIIKAADNIYDSLVDFLIDEATHTAVDQNQLALEHYKQQQETQETIREGREFVASLEVPEVPEETDEDIDQAIQESLDTARKLKDLEVSSRADEALELLLQGNLEEHREFQTRVSRRKEQITETTKRLTKALSNLRNHHATAPV